MLYQPARPLTLPLVIPAKAGIHAGPRNRHSGILEPRFRGNDGKVKVRAGWY
jgi:hypothetical protein